MLQHVTDFQKDTDLLQRDVQQYLQSYVHSKGITLTDLFLLLSKGSSSISTPNLRSALHHVGVELTKSQTSRLVRLVNLSQDGHIDLRRVHSVCDGQ